MNKQKTECIPLKPLWLQLYKNIKNATKIAFFNFWHKIFSNLLLNVEIFNLLCYNKIKYGGLAMKILSLKRNSLPSDTLFYQNKFKNAWFIVRLKTDSLYLDLDELNLVEAYADDFIIFKPGSDIFLESISSDECFFDFICFESESFTKALEKYPLKLNKPFYPNAGVIFELLILNVQNELNLGLTGYEEKIENSLYNFVIDLYNSFVFTAYEESRRKLINAKYVIFGDYKEEWNLENMAGLCEYSVSRFSSLYQKYFHISPVNDLIRFRVNKAKELLSLGGYTVSRVAEEVGFNSVQYFSKQFKKIVGVSPSQYIKNK